MTHVASAMLLLGLTILGCGARATASSLPDRAGPVSSESRWQDAFERTPELFLVIRPQALRHDKIYGPMLRRGIELARQHSRLAVATGALDVILEAEEVVVGAGGDGRRSTTGNQDAPDDLVVAVRGVRAEIDPVTLVDEGGIALWAPGPNAPSADVRELLRVHDRGGADASLFELPGRDWVIATGPARTRAREAFGRHSRGTGVATRTAFRILEELDPEALAVARVSGPALVAHVGSLRPPGMLAPIGHDLAAFTVALSPGEDAVLRATLEYSSHEARTLAEATVRDTIRVLVAAKPEEYGWLRSATVTRSECCILVTAPVPGRWLDKSREPASAPPAMDTAAHIDRRNTARYSDPPDRAQDWPVLCRPGL